MGIIIKYLMKNIMEKKFRTFIILLSVGLSAALFFASSALSGTLTEMYSNLLQMQTGKASLIISANKNSPSNYFRISNRTVEGVQMIAGSVSAAGNYEVPIEARDIDNVQRVRFHLQSFNIEELNEFNPIVFQKQGGGREFKGNHIILSSVFSEKYGYDVGDSISLEIAGGKRRLIVWGIAAPTGILKHNPQSETISAIVPMDMLTALLNVRGSVQTAYVMVEEGADMVKVKDTLEKQYPKYTIRETFSKEELENNLKMMTIPFFLMTTLVLFISIFIIYSTFKVITMERLPIIGTFRSIGATRIMTDRVLIGESLTYGVLGGILGNILGIAVLHLITKVLASDPYNGQLSTKVVFTITHILSSFILAVVVALVSSWLPIYKASKIPIKELVLNKIEGKHRKKRWKLFAAIIMMALSLILPRTTPNNIAMIISITSLLFSTTALIILVPQITVFLLRIFESLYSYIFGNEGILAAKNLKGNKNILNNISLLTIGISTILMINVMSHSVATEVLNAYGTWNFDIAIYLNQADRNTQQILQNIDGVSGTYGSYGSWNSIRVKDRNYSISYLEGIDTNKYRDYVDFNLDVDKEEALRQLNEGRNIIVAAMAKEIMGLEIGDTITLDMRAGEKTYNVIGFSDSIMANGSNGLIADKYYKIDMQQRYYDDIYIRTSKDPDEVLARIKNKFVRQGVWGSTVAEMERRNMESNNQMMIVLKAFSVMAMVIGVFGVFNNYMISFIERKRSIAMLRTIGLSKRQTLKMIFIESLTGGCVGGIIGIIGGLLMLSNIPYVMKALTIPIAVHYSLSFFISALVGGVIIAITASISPALKTSKLKAIEAIKYE